MKFFLLTAFLVAAVSCGPTDTEFSQSALSSGSDNFVALANVGRSVYLANTPISTSKETFLAFRASEMPALKIDEVAVESRQAIKEHLGLTDVQLRNLVAAKNHMINLSPQLLSVNFAQIYNGVPVKDAYVEVMYSKGSDGFYHLRQIDNQSFAQVDAPASAVSPNLADVEDVTGRHDFALIGSRSLVYPRKLDNGATEFLTATEFEVQGATELDGFFVTLSNLSKELLEVQPKSHNLTQINAKVLERSYFYNRMIDWQLPLTNLKVGDATTATDVNGEVDLVESTEAVLELASGRVKNREKTASGSAYTISANVESDENGQVLVATEGTDFRALNSYLAIHRAINHALQFVGEDEVQYFRNQVDLVFDFSGNCNAYYTSSGDSIRLYSSGGGCGAMAVVNDVIFHEWGHGYDYHTGRSGGITDGAFSEGIGDIIASYMTKSPNMGPGFKEGSETGIRNLDNNRMYPEDRGEVHYEGTIIGGAFWDLRVMLVDRFGDSRGSYLANDYFFRHLLTTDSYQESYKTVLALDDNDGDATTKSPNHCLINEAFSKHGLADVENCQDEASNIGTGDKNMYFALVDDKIAVSVQMADEVILCKGDAPACLASMKSDIYLILEGQKNGRRIFASTVDYSAKEQTILTAIAKNAQGKVTGYRSIKIAGK